MRRILPTNRRVSHVIIEKVNKLGDAFVVFVLGWFSWHVWLGAAMRDVDPVAGRPFEHYETWQVIGSALSIVTVVVVATVFWGRVVTVIPAAVGYTAGWALAAYIVNGQELTVLGTALVFLGAGVGTTAIATLTTHIREHMRGGAASQRAS